MGGTLNIIGQSNGRSGTVSGLLEGGVKDHEGWGWRFQADVGIIALSLARGPALRASGSYVEIPASLHPSLDQAAALVASSSKKEDARRFLAYLGSPEARATFQRFGFEPPAQRR
jgi:hypothetical protein